MYFRLLVISLFVCSNLYAIDEDIDGVDDSIDRCLNTSFDDLVDEHGCPQGENPQNKKSKTTLEIGSEVAYDQEDIRTSSLNFYVAYQYDQWSLAFSNRSYSIDSSSYDALDLAGDYYLMLGYTQSFESFLIQYSLGVKFPNSESDISSNERDYFAFVTLAYPMSDTVVLKGSYGYTLTGDSATQEYSNYHTLMLSTQYQINDKWQMNLGYKYSGSGYDEEYRTLSLKGCYKLSDSWFMRMGYERGLNDEAYANSLSLSLGVSF